MRELVAQSYPAPPWCMTGQLWAGLFRTQAPQLLPEGLGVLFSRRWLVVAVIRYLEGTLRYSELLVGRPARRGLRAGVYIEHLWVDSQVSLRGGREIWGLPKEPAQFQWRDDLVAVSDSAGPIVRLGLDRRGSRRPLLPLFMPGFGRLRGQWSYVAARGWACLARAEIVAEWSPRFAAAIPARPLVGVMAGPFSAIFPAPRLLGG